jgi:hypothetical protein
MLLTIAGSEKINLDPLVMGQRMSTIVIFSFSR